MYLVDVRKVPSSVVAKSFLVGHPTLAEEQVDELRRVHASVLVWVCQNGGYCGHSEDLKCSRGFKSHKGTRRLDLHTSPTGYWPSTELFLNLHQAILHLIKSAPMTPPIAPSSRNGTSSKNIQGLLYST